MKKIIILLLLVLIVSFSGTCFANEGESAENKPSNELLTEFIEATKQIENDEKYEPFLKMCAGATSKKTYLEFNTEKKEEDWNRLSLYEQAITYLIDSLPKQSMLGQNTNKHMASREAFLERIDVFKRYLDNVEGGSEVYMAIERVWNLHYNTWTNKRQFVSPFGGVLITRDTLNQVKEPVKNKEVEQSNSKNEIIDVQQELYNAITEDMTDEEQKNLNEEFGKSSKVVSILKKNMVSIGMLIIAIVVFVFFHLRRKSMNVDMGDE